MTQRIKNGVRIIKGDKMTQYTIQAYIPVGESEDETVYNSFFEAFMDIEELKFMQPENIYRIEKYEELTNSYAEPGLL